jgi:hypothetical protein
VHPSVSAWLNQPETRFRSRAQAAPEDPA